MGLSQSDLDNIAFALKREYGNFTGFISDQIIDQKFPGLSNSQKEYVMDLIEEINRGELAEAAESPEGILPEEAWANNVPLGDDARQVSPSGTYSGAGSGSVSFATNDAGTTVADILRKFGRR